MLIYNPTGFALGYTEQPVRAGSPSLTIILKATLRIVPGQRCVLHEAQLPLQGDTPHMDEIGRSLAWPNDMEPFKPHFDFLVLGSFYAPGGVAVSRASAGFAFGPLAKSLRIVGPRTAARTAAGQWRVTEPQPVSQVPLRWEFSFGGLSDHRNPYGRGHLRKPAAEGAATLDLPLIEGPDDPPWSPGHRARPANVAPVPAMFEGRRRKLGTRDRRWSLFRAPLPPDDYDPSYRNAAPDDQQAGNSPDAHEVLTLHNMHPEHPVLSCALPDLRPGLALVRTGETEAFEVPLRLDTAVAMPDRELLVLLWRAAIPCRTTDPESEIHAVECDSGPLPPGMLAARLTRRLREAAEADQAEQAKQDGAAISKVRDLLKDATLPPAVAAALATETSPAVLQSALEQYLGELIARLEGDAPA